jgi:GTPase SAR1 family protein
MEQYKIIFAGLANAGKTSLILTLKRQFSDLPSIKPTKGIERTELDILGFKIVTWDLGGQDQYRAEYKKKQAIIFADTELFYFLIDATADSNTCEEAIKYFQEIVEIYRLADPNHIPCFIVCLHKLDPNLPDKYSEQIKALSEKVETLLEGIDFKIFETSIYNLQTIIEAFSWGISKFLPKQSELDLIMKQFLSEYSTISIANLLEKQSMYLVHAYRDEKSHEYFNLLKDGIISIIENMGDQLHLLTSIINNETNLYIERLTILQRDYYFIVMGTDLDFEAIQKSLIDTYYTRIEKVVLADTK